MVMRPARPTLAGLILLATSGGASHASAPVSEKLTACVLDGVMITLDGYRIKPRTPALAPFDLTPYDGKKIALGGNLYPGDAFTVTSAVTVLGTCSAEEKLKLIPALTEAYRKRAE